MSKDQIYPSTDTQGFFAIEREMQKRREQCESVKGKATPFRVEFRYPRGCKQWQYFETYDSATKAESSRCRYSIYGHAIIESPTSRQIQVQGPRGGWKKYKPERKASKP